MAKFYGNVGFVDDVAGAVDVTIQLPHERPYKGDIIKSRRKLESGLSTADNISLGNQISIVADPYIMEHIFAMRYVCWMGSRWKVSDVEVAYPRLILTISGLYNGETPNPDAPISNTQGV